MENLNELKHESIDKLITNGYEFRLWHYITSAFKIYRKYFWGFAGFMAVMIVILIGVTFLIRLPSSISMIASRNFHSAGFILSILLSALVSGLLGFILSNGYFIVARKICSNENYSFDNFFDGFKHWKKLTCAYLMIFIVLLIFYVLPIMDIIFGLINHFIPYPSERASMIFSQFRIIDNIWISGTLLIAGIYLNIGFKWTQLFIIFTGMKSIKAVITSLKIITKRWIMVTAFYIVTYVIIFFPLMIILPLNFYIVHLQKDHGFLHSFLLIIVFEIAIFLAAMILVIFATPILYIALYNSFEDVVGTAKADN